MPLIPDIARIPGIDVAGIEEVRVVEVGEVGVRAVEEGEVPAGLRRTIAREQDEVE